MSKPRVAMLAEVETERLELCKFLDKLDAADWKTPSLCPAWTIHDVVAHLTLSNRQKVGSALLRGLRARGDFNRATAELATDRAARYTPAELVGQLRETAGLDRRFAMAADMDPLTDILVHWQDIARPLGHERATAPDRGTPALEHILNVTFYGAPQRFEGLRAVATDADWSTGSGEEVHATVGDLLLLATGRRAGLAAATGPGSVRLAERL